MSRELAISSLDAFVFRAPLDTPVEASFGIMRDRPMALVRAVDRDGVTGWGEIWCNFPAVGAEHRARLVSSIFAPMLTARTFDTPSAAYEFLAAKTAVLAIQCAEPGPFAQTLAAIDIALHDLAARRDGQPLWRWLGGASPRIRVYASGLNPTAPERLAATRLADGHRAFKLKIGFGRDRDVANLERVRSVIGSASRLMVDANQAWSCDEAHAMLPELARFDLGWLEEPIRADRPWSEWHALSTAAGPLNLAAGENLIGEPAFAAAMAEGRVGVVQPDIAKWGGFTRCLPVARSIRAAGRRFCPHYLGGGVGLVASAHLLAAAGGDGMLEIDANPNPLRSLVAGPVEAVSDGWITLSESPGLGIPDTLATLEPYRVLLT